MVVRRKKAAKKTAKKRTLSTGLKKYQTAVKRATKTVDSRIKKAEAGIRKLKTLKAKKVKAVRRRFKK